MAFHEIERGEFHGREQLVNTVHVNITPSTTQLAAITISNDIYKRLGEPMFVKLMLGTGEHSGFIAIVPRNTKGVSSYKVMQPGGPNALVKIAVSPAKIGLVKKAIGIVPVPFEITEDGLIADIRPARKASVTKILEAAE